MTVGERIKLRRTRLGISQTLLAERIGTSKQNLYKYENNIITNIPSDKIVALAECLYTTPAYLMGWEHGMRLGNLIIPHVPDYAVRLENIFIDSETYRLLSIFAADNHRTLQEEIENRLYESLEEDIGEITNREMQDEQYAYERKQQKKLIINFIHRMRRSTRHFRPYHLNNTYLRLKKVKYASAEQVEKTHK